MPRLPKRLGQHGAVAMAVIALATATGACSDGRDSADAVTLANLVRFAERYDGQRVATSGRVRTHPEPRHYWIEDDELNRVAVEPAAAVADRVGKRVRIEGVFHYSSDKGRFINVEVDRGFVR